MWLPGPALPNGLIIIILMIIITIIIIIIIIIIITIIIKSRDRKLTFDIKTEQGISPLGGKYAWIQENIAEIKCLMVIGPRVRVASVFE